MKKMAESMYNLKYGMDLFMNDVFEEHADMSEKYSFSDIWQALTSKEANYTDEEISNNTRLINSARIYWLIVYVLVFFLLWGLSALVIWPAYKFIKPLKKRVAKEQKRYLALLLGELPRLQLLEFGHLGRVLVLPGEFLVEAETVIDAGRRFASLDVVGRVASEAGVIADLAHVLFSLFPADGDVAMGAPFLCGCRFFPSSRLQDDVPLRVVRGEHGEQDRGHLIGL